MDFLQRYPKCSYYDQDALNYLFSEEYHPLSGHYNIFPCIEQAKLPIDKKIYHYTSTKPGTNLQNPYDRLFWSYLVRTPWLEENCLLRFFSQLLPSLMTQQLTYIRMILVRVCTKEKRLLFGPSEPSWKKPITDNFLLQPIDSYIEYDNSSMVDRFVYLKDRLHQEKGAAAAILFISLYTYLSIKVLLIKEGFVENQDFFYGRALLTVQEGGDELDDRAIVRNL